MKVFCLIASGKYTETVNGVPQTADNLEIVAVYLDKDKAYAALTGPNPPDVKEPKNWSVYTICGYEAGVIAE